MALWKKQHAKMSQSIAILLMSTAILLAGCSQAQPTAQNSQSTVTEKKVTILRNFKTESLDPHNSWEPLRAGVVETLVRLDERLEMKPWLATTWEAKDAKTWVFTIRDGVTFHDGSKLDGSAVKASLERAMTVNKKLANALKIASIEANGQQITITTSEPYPALPSELINPYAAIVSTAAEQKLGRDAFNHAPVGTGPFKVKQFTPNIEIALERYDGYWDGQAKLSEISFKFNEDGNVRALALQSKEADIVYGVPVESVEAIKQDPQLTVASKAGLRVHYLLYNQQKPLLQDLRVRQALDALLNRTSIAEDVMMGQATPANGPFNTTLPFGSRDKVREMQIEEAKKSLEALGYTMGADGKMSKDGVPLTLQLVTYKGRPELPLIAQVFQSDAAKAGVTIQIHTVEDADTYLRENKDWDLATYSNLSAPRGDGSYFLNSALMPNGSLNPSQAANENLSKLITQLNATNDLAARIELTQKAVDVVNQEVLHSYIVYPNLLVGMNKRVTGWSPGAEEYYMVTNNMDVQ